MSDREPSVFVVGSGRAATVLAGRLLDSGVPVFGMWGRNRKRVGLAAQRAMVPAFSGKPPPITGNAAVVLIAVSDDAIPRVSQMLTDSGVLKKGQIVAHTSGMYGPERLIATAGVMRAAFHPCLAFTDIETARVTLPGSTAVIEGPPKALKVLRRLAQTLGMHYHVLPKGGRTAYHAGACMASNYLVTLTEAAVASLEAAGLNRTAAKKILLPLMRGTIENLRKFDTAEALTGPIVRGDVNTVRAHWEVLSGEKEARDLYAKLGEATCLLARKQGIDCSEVLKIFKAARPHMRGARQNKN